MTIGRALGAGVAAAAAAAGAAGVARLLLGARTDPVAVLGALLVGHGGAGAWLVGLAAHVGGGGAIALGYAAAFDLVFGRAGAWRGIAVAVPHTVATGLLAGWAERLRPAAFGPRPPGAFLGHDGAAAVVTLLVFDLTYGALVGAWYPTPGGSHAGSGAPGTHRPRAETTEP